MSRMPHRLMLLAIVLLIALVGCEREKEDPLAAGGPDGVAPGEVVVDAPPAAEATIEVATPEAATGDLAPLEEEATGGDAAPAEAVEDVAPPTVVAVEPETESDVEEPETVGAGGEVDTRGDVPAGADETAEEVTAPATDTAAPPAAAEQVYTVVAGDTLFSIATRYGVTVDALKGANALGTNFIFVGQTLTIPVAGVAPVAPVEPAPPNSGPTVHIVQPGEWIYQIARLYGVTPQSIIAANGLTQETIFPGQQLVIP